MCTNFVLYEDKKIVLKKKRKLLTFIIKKYRYMKEIKFGTFDFIFVDKIFYKKHVQIIKPVKYNIIPFSFELKKSLTFIKGRKTTKNTVYLKFTNSFNFISLILSKSKKLPKFYIYKFYIYKKKFIFTNLIDKLLQLKK